MPKTYTIKEVCKLTSVSIRTLHYYDEINLLKPYHRSKKGRLYSDTNLACLQHIVTLKYMGFSLLQIKKYLQDEEFNIFAALKMQVNALTEEAERIKRVSSLLEYVLHQHELNQPIEWETITKIIAILKLKENNRTQWADKYLNTSELKTFTKFYKKRTQKWVDLFNEIKEVIDYDPADKHAQRLVKKWHQLADAAYAENPELKGKLWEGYKAGIIPGVPHDKNVITFLTKATDSMKRR